MVTKFKHPTQDYFVHVILDPCHMLKLARNALATLSTFSDNNNGQIKWAFFQNLNTIQQKEGLKLYIYIHRKQVVNTTYEIWKTQNERKIDITNFKFICRRCHWISRCIHEATRISRQPTHCNIYKNNWQAIWHFEIQLEKVTSSPYDHNQKIPGNQCSKQQQPTC